MLPSRSDLRRRNVACARPSEGLAFDCNLMIHIAKVEAMRLRRVANPNRHFQLESNTKFPTKCRLSLSDELLSARHVRLVSLVHGPHQTHHNRRQAWRGACCPIERTQQSRCSEGDAD